MAWLRTQRLRRSQFRSPRRQRVRGVIVVHTAENPMHTGTPDRGAENVANFIRDRTDPGSYHDLVDSDSAIQLVDYDDEAFQDGTGSNPWAYGLSFACRTTDWTRMTAARRAAFIDNGARRAAAQARHCKARTGIDIPARRITRAESERGVPGFISHGDRDPGRRSDPGAQFPWTEFLAAYARHMGTPAAPAPTPPPAPKDWFTMATREDLRAVVAAELAKQTPSIQAACARDARDNKVWAVGPAGRFHIANANAYDLLVLAGVIENKPLNKVGTIDGAKFLDGIPVCATPAPPVKK